jgi:Holliday junction resolvase RusA-like endonuclease
VIELDVLGLPAPQGSKRGFVVGNRAVVVEGGSKTAREKVGTWRQDVIDACTRYRLLFPDTTAPTAGPVRVELRFALPRPKSAPKSRRWPTVKPDLDKLVRSTLDALKLGQMYQDDSQVVDLWARKTYTVDGVTGAIIIIKEAA